MKKMREMISIFAANFLVGGTLAAFAAAKPDVEAAKSTNNDEQIIHLLNRTCFGPRPGDIDHVKKIGIQAYIEEQLSPANIQDPFDDNGRPEILAMRANPIDIVRQFRQMNMVVSFRRCVQYISEVLFNNYQNLVYKRVL
jgi:hypothetical protein